MRYTTPFFSAFGKLLFGRRRGLKLRPETPESLPELQALFGRFVPEELAAKPARGANSRKRIFSPEVTFWAFLFQVLSPACACREVVRKVQAWWPRRGAQLSGDTSAYCQGRKRLPLGWLAGLLEQLATRLQSRVLDAELWLGHRVKVVDGTTLSMPDTPDNQARWPQSAEQAPGCGFPLLKMAGLFCLHSGALVRHAIGNKHDHEAKLFRQLWPCFTEGDVLLTDRGFCSFGVLAGMLDRGVDCVLRLHVRRPADFRRGHWLGPQDRLVTWARPQPNPRGLDAEGYTALPEKLTLRLVRFRVEVPGFRSEEIVLATTLLDPTVYSKAALAALYLQRWQVELRLREIKTTLGCEVLRCQRPAMIEKELCLHLIGYNLIRCVMQEAAHRHHVPLPRLSFTGSRDTLRQWADAFHAHRHRPRRRGQLWRELLAIIAHDQLPDRPNRVEPRAKKRRPKNYALLNRPRHRIRVPKHRSRQRSVPRRKPALS